MIMQKLDTGNYANGDVEEEEQKEINPKVQAAYQKMSLVMKTFRSGKLPKAFKIIPQVANWEQLLDLTSPATWSPQATRAATEVFASNLNSNMAQRYYNFVLLPNVRENINKFKKLNCHLYEAIKKAMWKTSAFFKGFILPLVEDGCTAREAVIIGSILGKMSIN